ncbi:MAG: tetratricopeptide repeat protein [Gemmatimonadota bacterium]|nr:tetratricopeptide repeat protein [Gemmatimonadota bacterium]
MIRALRVGGLTLLVSLPGPLLVQAQEEGPPADTLPAIGIEATLPDPGLSATLVDPGSIDPAERFQSGNSLYQVGDFEGALAAYQQILDAGVESGDLHYNIGNAQFKLGRLGPAILSYERAREVSPSDENVLANLGLARSLTSDQITPLPGFWVPRAWSWWVDLLPRGLLLGVVALGYLLTMSLIIVRITSRGGIRRAVGPAVAVVAALTLIFTLNLAIRQFGLGRSDFGVVMVVETPVQSAPADDPGLQLFSIHEGTRVRIDRVSDGWLEIVLDDGQVGWLRATAIERI